MPNIGEKSFISSLILISSQWISRLLGMISIVILARILSPEDYGVVAVAQLTISFLQIILFNGSGSYLIRKQKIDDDDLNTAWSIGVILSLLMTILLIINKENISLYFSDPRLIDIIFFLSLGNFVGGFQNIGHIIYTKRLEYKKIFFHNITIKITSFIITVSAALYMQNYWALIYGLIVMQVTTTISSFYFFEYRPKFNFSKIKAQWNFTKWIFLSNFTSFIRNKLDQLLISKFLGVKSLGFFNMTYQLTNMPYTEIVEPIQQVVYSSYSSVLDNKKKLANMFIQVIGVISIIAFPLYLGLLAVTKDIVLLILGKDWVFTVTLFPMVILLLMAQTLTMLATNMLTVLGKVKILTGLNWLLVLIMIPALLYIISFESLELFIQWRAIIAILFIPIVYITVFMYLKININKLILAIIRPLCAAITMYYVINNLSIAFEILPISLALVFKILLGADVFIVTLVFLWKFTKKNIGGEEFILDKIIFVASKKNFLKHLLTLPLIKILK